MSRYIRIGLCYLQIHVFSPTVLNDPWIRVQGKEGNWIRLLEKRVWETNLELSSGIGDGSKGDAFLDPLPHTLPTPPTNPAFIFEVRLFRCTLSSF